MVANKFFQESKAIIRGIRVSPIKLGLVTDLIRGKKVDDALKILEFSKRRISAVVKKAVISAISNAENNYGMDIDSLWIGSIHIGRGSVLKRWRPRARGRIGRIQKPFSNLTVIVREELKL